MVIFQHLHPYIQVIIYGIIINILYIVCSNNVCDHHYLYLLLLLLYHREI